MTRIYHSHTSRQPGDPSRGVSSDEPKKWTAVCITDDATIAKSKQFSWDSLAKLLPTVNPSISADQFRGRLEIALKETIAALKANEDIDATKKTQTARQTLRRYLGQLQRKGSLPWYNLCKLARFEKEVGAKSRECVEQVVKIGELHPALEAFQHDMKRYQDLLFDCAEAAIAEQPPAWLRC